MLKKYILMQRNNFCNKLHVWIKTQFDKTQFDYNSCINFHVNAGIFTSYLSCFVFVAAITHFPVLIWNMNACKHTTLMHLNYYYQRESFAWNCFCDLCVLSGWNFLTNELKIKKQNQIVAFIAINIETDMI